VNEPCRFWRALEARPTLADVAAGWRKAVDDDFDAARGLFHARRERALSFPNPNGGEPYAVIEHAPDDLVGVCPETGATVPLTPGDLVVYRFDLPKCLRLLREAFHLDGEGDPLAKCRGLHQVGWDRPLAGFEFPVYSIFASGKSAFRASVDAVLGRVTGPFLLFAPTSAFQSVEVRDLMAARSSLFLPLADAVVWDGERWQPTESARRALEAFRERALPKANRAGESVLFPTPTGATWQQLQMRFLDGHQVQVRIGDLTRALSYTQMGMAKRSNGQPTVQWQLLTLFAKERGQLTWHSPGAHRKNQKRKDLLAGDLKAFFRIDGEPFRFLPAEKGWQALFQVDWPD